MPRRGGHSGLLERTRKQRKTRGHKKEARNAKKEKPVKQWKLAAILAALLMALGVAAAAVASGGVDKYGCPLMSGLHCKDLEAAGTTVFGSTTDATTTDATTTTATTTTASTTTSTTPTPPQSSGTVDQTEEWKCPGAVNMQLVKITIGASSKSTDAVQLTNGCTGYIGEIDVIQYKGDGVHLNDAHDLVIGKLVVRCYAHVPLKHQDGMQVMGGQRVTIKDADIGCYSANNSQVWINDGAGGAGPGGVPTDVVFDGGKFQGYFNGGQYGPGGSYGVSIGSSVRTGFRNVTVCPNAHTARQFNVMSSAVDPVRENVQLPTSC